MEESALKSGDAVIQLSGLVMATGIISGAVSAAFYMWAKKKTFFSSLAGFLAGTIVGFIIAWMTGKLFYQSGDHVAVIKPGASSLGETIPAGLLGALCSSYFACIFISLILNKTASFEDWSKTATITGIVIGLIFAILTSLV